MEASYLTRTLDEMKCGTLDYPQGLDNNDKRKVTLHLEVGDVYLLERFAAHYGMEPADFGREVFAAALSEAADIIRVEGVEIEQEMDEYCEAWSAFKASQDYFAGALAGWKHFHLVRKSKVYLDLGDGLRAESLELGEASSGDHGLEPVQVVTVTSEKKKRG